MSIQSQNIALVRRMVTALNRGDLVAMRELTAPDHVQHELHHDPLPLPGTDDQPLLDRYDQSNATIFVDFPDTELTIDDQFASGDRVVTLYTARGTHARSGRLIEQRGVAIDRVADGKIAETWGCWDRLGVFQQLGAVASTRELAGRADLTLS
jgi:ketosteroid isomerase-like protein